MTGQFRNLAIISANQPQAKKTMPEIPESNHCSSGKAVSSMKSMSRFFLLILIAIAAHSTSESASAQSALSFKVTLNAELTDEPVTGRVLVFLSRRNDEPMNGPNWFSPEPFYGINVEDLAPGDSVILDPSANGFPKDLSEPPTGRYYVQAILDHDFYQANHADGVGNFFSEPVRISFGRDGESEIGLELSQAIPERTIEETDWFKVVELESQLLEEFHNRPVIERAGVVLPASYESSPDRRYPVYYDISGFGGTMEMMAGSHPGTPRPPRDDNAEFIKVYLTGQCKWGHHVYANSATNGPRGDALVQEMIPLIDSTFRTIAEPTARFVSGHSSGGWSSLWLQVSYPDSFGGVWSTAPDPVDFRDFQRTNLYDGSSVFVDPDGQHRPLARMGEQPIVWYDDFSRMDDTLGRGGQLRSFEAVFSPLDENGLPAKCWDRETGAVDPQVAEYWKQYDIGLKLADNWTELEPKLRGKIHVYMGTLDTFYLEGATMLLKQRLEELKSDAVVELFEGKDHGSVMSRQLRNRIAQEMTEMFRANHPDAESGDNKE